MRQGFKPLPDWRNAGLNSLLGDIFLVLPTLLAGRAECGFKLIAGRYFSGASTTVNNLQKIVNVMKEEAKRKKEEGRGGELPITNYQFPMPHAPCPKINDRLSTN